MKPTKEQFKELLVFITLKKCIMKKDIRATISTYEMKEFIKSKAVESPMLLSTALKELQNEKKIAVNGRSYNLQLYKNLNTWIINSIKSTERLENVISKVPQVDVTFTIDDERNVVSAVEAIKMFNILQIPDSLKSTLNIHAWEFESFFFWTWLMNLIEFQPEKCMLIGLKGLKELIESDIKINEKRLQLAEVLNNYYIENEKKKGMMFQDIDWTAIKDKFGIYRIEDTTNGKNYIGKAEDISQRWKQHIAATRTSDRKPLYEAMREHGLNNFRFYILEECTPLNIYERENFYINEYNALSDEGYNNRGGDIARINRIAKHRSDWNL